MGAKAQAVSPIAIKFAISLTSLHWLLALIKLIQSPTQLTSPATIATKNINKAAGMALKRRLQRMMAL
jgi:hypothetical protein